MRSERRAEELKNGAKEGTDPDQRDPSRGEQQLRLPLADSGGRSGEAAAGQRRWTYDTGLRTFRKRAMYENLMENAVTEENRELALQAVTRNKGAAGIDRMPVRELESHLQANWEKIKAKLLNGTYVPSPVRRVEIPKPSGGTRTLGIPTVQDRFIQQLLLQVMTPVYEPLFSEHSYGFRPGRSAHDAMRAAQKYAQEGKGWVVDIDITKFFDHVSHDILLGGIGQTIRDKRVLALIGKYLRRGAMVNGVVTVSEEGTPQGGPLSPLLANIYLDALDKELERRGHAFCRYADDCNIYVGSQAAAERTLVSIRNWIEKRLRLKVNEAKSGTGGYQERKFLGFRLNREKLIGIATESLERLKAKVRELFESRRSKTSNQIRDAWRTYVRGWWSYFQLAEDRAPVLRLEGWIRRHIRKCFWQRWHNRKGRVNKLRQLGIKGPWLQTASSSRGAWRIAAATILQMALSNETLRKSGFLMPSDLAASRC
jgi:RNA-directed DNA polymerase